MNKPLFSAAGRHKRNPPVCRAGCSGSDELCIGDCGNYFFYYSTRENDWRVYADCY